MSKQVINSMGLGSSTSIISCDQKVDCVTGNVIDCSAVWGNSVFQLPNILNPSCWDLCTAPCAAGGAAIGTPGTAAASCDVSIFGETSCIAIGSTTFGTTTLLLLGALAVVAFFIFGGRK
jgi:hypothetical protein